MTKRFRAGIIGAGFIGGVHAHAVHASGGVVSRVAGSSPDAAWEGAQRLGAEAAADSAEDLINATDVDVVHICTPNATHVPLAELVIAAGKPVICEKPLAMNVPDAQRLTAAVATAGVVNAVPFVYRFYPTVREARARIAAEDAQLWLLHGTYLQDWLAGSGLTNWRVDPALGGSSRAFGDIGVHWCDLMEFTTGHRITRLTARLAIAIPERRSTAGMATVGTEDGAIVMFETDRGASGIVVVSQVSPGRRNRLWFEFDGTSTSYVFNQELPDSLWVGGVKRDEVITRGPDRLAEAAARYARVPAGHPQGYQDCFNAFVADVYAAIGGAKPDGLPTFADGLRAAELTAAVLESAKRETWMEVPS